MATRWTLPQISSFNFKDVGVLNVLVVEMAMGLVFVNLL